MFPYDATLLATVQAAPQSIADVLQTLGTIDTTCIDGDGLKWFNWLYLQVTQAVEAQVACSGFTDPAWLAQLDVQFARLYFSALKSSLSGQVTPTCRLGIITSLKNLTSGRSRQQAKQPIEGRCPICASSSPS